MARVQMISGPEGRICRLVIKVGIVAFTTIIIGIYDITTLAYFTGKFKP